MFKGTYELLNLSEEYDPNEVDVTISFKDGKQEGLRNFIKSQGLIKFREQMTKYINLLREGTFIF